MRRILHLTWNALIGIVLAVCPLWAGEYAVLDNGFRLYADRHEADAGSVRLYAAGGVTEMAASRIVRFEQEEAIPAPAAPAPVAAAGPAALESAPVVVTPKDLAAAAARKFSLPETFVQSVMRAESAFQPGAISQKGAVGLMQLMPETARQMGIDAKNPKQNAEAGAQYLRDLLAKYENNPDQVVLALAAYNAGPAAVDRYHGVPPYRETREYILRVLANWDRQENHK